MALPARTLHKFISGIREWHEKILDRDYYLYMYAYLFTCIDRDIETDIYRYCKQFVIDTTTFQSYQTQQLYTIFHKLNCKSKFIIYLMECALCKIQYVGKAETAFNIRLNNHGKDVNN